MNHYLSDYYGHEPIVDSVISFTATDGSHSPRFICKYLWEGECSTTHCSHCAGWVIENVPDEYRVDLEHDNVRIYYPHEYGIYHEAEVDEILNNMLLTGNYHYKI